MSISQHAESPENHNAPAQHYVVENDDAALDKSQEHPHRHMRHAKHAEQGSMNEPVYSEGTTFDKSTIPHQDPDHELARRCHVDLSKAGAGGRDSEKGDMGPVGLEDEGPQTRTLSSFYGRYRVFFHLFVWLFFTGYVLPRGNSKGLCQRLI